MGRRVVIIISFVIAIIASFFVGRLEGYELIVVESEETFPVFMEVKDQLINNHFSQPTEEDLISGALEGMISSLEDPFTSYYDIEEVENYQQSFTEAYVGIGVTLTYLEKLIVVQVVKENGPADMAGIRVNDVIAMVDGENVLGNPFYETIRKIIGNEGTKVSIGIIRTGVIDIINFTMTRAAIDSETVIYDSFMRDEELIGYIKVTTFGNETASQFVNAIVDLETAGITGLIIDLRDNSGGHLETVIDMLNQFLIDDGSPMFSTEHFSNGNLQRDEYTSDRDEPRLYPIVTIVNENSASASEVFASSMQEHGNFTVVGVTTFGKGTMQTGLEIVATVGDRLHITIGKWFTSNGNWIHTVGVTPDIIAEQSPIERAYKVFLINEEETFLFDTIDLRVANVQIILNMMGYTVRTDGYYDTFTRDAILDIQSSNALTETGNMGSETLIVINAALDVFRDDLSNDSQLEAAITYLLND